MTELVHAEDVSLTASAQQINALAGSIAAHHTEQLQDRPEFGNPEHIHYRTRTTHRRERIAELERQLGAYVQRDVRAWSWTSDKGNPVTASLSPHGWRTSSSQAPGWEPCTSVVKPQVNCPDRAVWQVQRHDGKARYASHYCDGHLPTAYRPTQASPAA